MRALLATAGISLALGLSAGALGSPARQPALRVGGLTLFGDRFHARERVQVTFYAAARTVRRVRTDAAGSFATPVPAYDSCLRPLTVKAVGSHGDAAILKVPKRACMPD